MPSAKPARDTHVAGLICPATRTPVALERVDVRAHAIGPCCRVVVRQHFRNRETVPLELVYVFPLDEDAAVCGFDAIVDGTRFAGRVKERDEAFADYDDAMAAGHGAYLLDEERADVFTASLGNVRPGAEVQLAITYVTTLAAEGAGLRFSLPTTVSPRYAPAADCAGVGPTPAEALNPPTAVEVPYRLTFELQAEMPGNVRRVESPTHPISTDCRGREATVRLAQRDTAMDRDLVLVIDAEGLDAPAAIAEATPSGVATMVTLVPSFATTSAPAELVFLVDRSGSMGGTSIAEVRNALDLCLRALTAGCHFDIVGFGSTFESLFGRSVPYDEASLQKASAAIEAMDANMGGTEILPALEHVLGRQRVDGLARQVVLLTDGEVTNTDAVIALARRHAGHARIFTFGIGAGASAHLVRAVARASGGAAEFIAPGERIEAKVLRQFGRVLAPALTDVRVEWPAGVTGAPEVPPAVFHGERLVLFGLSGSAPSGRVRVMGSLSGQPFEAHAELNPPCADTGVVGPLAARARIRDLEERPDYLEAKGSQQRRARRWLDDRGETLRLGLTRSLREEVVRLAVAHQLVSRETSLVAIEQRDAPVTARAELRRVPVALTSGWGGLRRLGVHAQASASVAMMAAPPSATGPGSSHADLASMHEAAFQSSRSIFHAFRSMGESKSARPPASEAVGAPPHVVLLRLQRAEGCWDFDARFERAVGARLYLSPRRLSQVIGPDEAVRRRALATAIALAWLEQHAADLREEWELAADKARAWLRGCGASTAHGEPWEDMGRALLAG